MPRRRANGSCRVRLEVVNRTRTRLPPRRTLERAARSALAGLGSAARGRKLGTTLVCVGGARMRELNRRFTGRAELTDVLSFSEREPDPEDGFLRVGEVVICSQVARREARDRGLSVRGELLLYAIHGWLHLAGYRDGAPRGRRRMVRAEKRIMRALGLRRD
jgi:probable rRNA maturation factor